MSKRREIVEQHLADAGIENAVFIDGHDDALIGVAYQQYQGPYIVYDRQAILEAVTEELDGDEESAIEFVEFNIDGAYVGTLTPLLLTRVEQMDD